MNKFSQDDYLKKRIKEIYKGRPCNLCVMNGELFKRDSSGNLTQIFTDPDFYLDKIQEKILNDEERRDRKISSFFSCFHVKELSCPARLKPQACIRYNRIRRGETVL